MKICLLLLVLPALFTGCYRTDLKTLTVEIPEAGGNEAELDAIKRTLLKEEDRLRTKKLYEKIQVDTGNSSLIFSYHSEYLADMNVLHKINALGYQAGELPGDPQKRLNFLRQNAIPIP